MCLFLIFAGVLLVSIFLFHSCYCALLFVGFLSCILKHDCIISVYVFWCVLSVCTYIDFSCLIYMVIRVELILAWRVQQYFYCCVCIRYRGNVSTEPLLSNDKEILPSRCVANIRGFSLSHDKGIFTETLPISDKGNFNEPLPSNDRGMCRHTQTATWSHKPTFNFQNKEKRLKRRSPCD
jgi:hypothetical protein